jgi:hydroxymethylbilane synthase
VTSPPPPGERPWRIATRRSSLARTQAQQVADALTTVTGRPAELVPLATSGDDHPERAIEAFDAKGLFVDGTRQAVLSGDCDMVVHSFKDLPTEAAPGLVVAAVPRRVDPRDALITRDGHRLATLPRDRPITIGTSSNRRRAQIMRTRRDVLVQPLRGNLGTRLGKVADGVLDGVVVAMAGLLRSGGIDLDLRVVALENGEMLHAAAQGALAVEARVGDATTRKALRKLDHADTRRCVAAEREMLAHLGGGCTSPIGAHAELLPGQGDDARRIELLGMLTDPNGTRLYRASHQAADTEPELLGRTLAATLLNAKAEAEGTVQGYARGGH